MTDTPASADDAVFALTLVSALATALVAGVFFGFSSFVMKALAALPPDRGIAAMQSINAMAPTPVFMTAFTGTAGLGVLGAVVSAVEWGKPGAALLLAGSALYVAGCFLLTVVVHIPRNTALMNVEPDGGAEAEEHWRRYVSVWTAWNHVRSASALAASACLTFSLLDRA